jgi:hypothetical protein
MLEQLAAELEERFDAEDKAASTNPNNLLGPPPTDNHNSAPFYSK